jgi:single-strand DNA-binding protein
MANFNKVVLVGRLTRDPETRTFSTGGMVAKFGFAVTNRKKNSQSGQWEDEPMFIDCEAYNRGEFGKTADLVRDRLRKGSQILLEGKLHLDTWQDKQTGQNRSKHKLVVDNIQFLDPRQDGMGGGMGGGDMGDEMGGGSPPPARRPAAGGGGGGGGRTSAPPRNTYTPPDDDHDGGSSGGGGGDDIPF